MAKQVRWDRIAAIATDYDGTLAHDGEVSASTRHALRRLRGSGRLALMVTGREIPDLMRAFDELTLFDLVVAENGALIHDPATGRDRALAPPPPPELISGLQTLGVTPLSVGACIVATREPHEIAVLETIRRLGLEWSITFNKGAVMALPNGVTKATGLSAALAQLALKAEDVAGVGDAENDHAFLQLCGASVAVANALPSVKALADWTTAGARGDGVAEMIERILAAEPPTRD